MGWDGWALLVQPPRIPRRYSKIIFVLGADYSLERLESKTRKGVIYIQVLNMVVDKYSRVFLIM